MSDEDYKAAQTAHEKAILSVSAVEVTIKLTPALTCMSVLATTKEAVYLRLPRELQRPISCGCGCEHCTKNPTLAKWDTLVVPIKPKPGHDFTYTVHMPDGSVAGFIEYVRLKEYARKQGR